MQCLSVNVVYVCACVCVLEVKTMLSTATVVLRTAYNLTIGTTPTIIGNCAE